MTLTDLLRRELFLNRFSWHAQDYPRYVTVKRELRREVTAAAADTGMATAIASFGDPRQLASDYLANLERPYPRWSSGVWWAGAGLYTITFLGIAYALGVNDALEGSGGGTLSAVVFGTPVLFTHTAEQLSAEFQFTWASLGWFLVATVPLFLLGARVWRLWSRGSRASVPAPARPSVR